MAGNISVSAGAAPAQSRTSVSGGFSLPAQAPVRQAPAPVGYGLAYQMGGPTYMYGETPRYGAYYRDGGIVPGQIYGNMRGSREGADMFGFWPTMFQSSPYATASQMYTPGLGVMPLIGYPSRYPHVIMGGYSDYGAGIANQAMGMMLPLLMMGLYRQMFPMPGAAPAAAAKGAGGGGKGGSGGSGGDAPKQDAVEWPALPASYGEAPSSDVVNGAPPPSPDLLELGALGLPKNYAPNGKPFFDDRNVQITEQHVPLPMAKEQPVPLQTKFAPPKPYFPVVSGSYGVDANGKPIF